MKLGFLMVLSLLQTVNARLELLKRDSKLVHLGPDLRNLCLKHGPIGAGSLRRLGSVLAVGAGDPGRPTQQLAGPVSWPLVSAGAWQAMQSVPHSMDH